FLKGGRCNSWGAGVAGLGSRSWGVFRICLAGGCLVGRGRLALGRSIGERLGWMHRRRGVRNLLLLLRLLRQCQGDQSERQYCQPTSPRSSADHWKHSHLPSATSPISDAETLNFVHLILWNRLTKSPREYLIC